MRGLAFRCQFYLPPHLHLHLTKGLLRFRSRAAKEAVREADDPIATGLLHGPPVRIDGKAIGKPHPAQTGRRASMVVRRHRLRVVEACGRDVDLVGELVRFEGERSSASWAEGACDAAAGCKSCRRARDKAVPRARHREPRDDRRARCAAAHRTVTDRGMKGFAAGFVSDVATEASAFKHHALPPLPIGWHSSDPVMRLPGRASPAASHDLRLRCAAEEKAREAADHDDLWPTVFG